MEHNHSVTKLNNNRALIIALGLTVSFFIAEVVAGILTESLALLSDAAHMLTDITALIIALVAVKLSQRAADKVRTFGYYRFEILAAAFNTVMLFVVALYIFYEAYHRLQNPPEIQSIGMLIVASIGLVVNLISMRLLTSHKDKSLIMKSAYLEVWSDMLGSVAVIVGAIIIKLTELNWVDSVIAILISLWVLPRTYILLKESINILLEGVPKGIDLKKLEQALLEIKGVLDVHELHVWAIASGKICLTAHVIIEEKSDCESVLPIMRTVLASQFGILHTTLQHERKKCLNEQVLCNFLE
ncbi:cation diffusion facilitator family transporter [Candidatus Berkiella aquae]|uniref:Cation diffusion facilitator family transporter n=1 Tax=Candidatus Berkiella aquae TaxID=295108 RepID=A0A0Q9YRC0_9GAMM|nr:cation diffusion facilitator family transporter [Candidatus Berkiella aquae]MCS5712802.1 cation diffusion facilitator family transporter [Candidatus Berkiella aquae]